MFDASRKSLGAIDQLNENAPKNKYPISKRKEDSHKALVKKLVLIGRYHLISKLYIYPLKFSLTLEELT
jgi:hypothetical protein